MKPVENMDMSKIMPDFFSSETANLELVKHTKKVLQRLSKFLQIIVLTNLPHKDKGKRENAMIKNNLNFTTILLATYSLFILTLVTISIL